jgi:hypothetical protein
MFTNLDECISCNLIGLIDIREVGEGRFLVWYCLNNSSRHFHDQDAKLYMRIKLSAAA